MTKIDNSQKFCRGANLEVNELPDGYMVTVAQTGRIHYLNPVAAIVFELCDGSQPVASITKRLKREFSLDETPGTQVESCLSTLLNEGLIAPCPT